VSSFTENVETRTCFCCSKEITRDHFAAARIIPESKGGITEPVNFLPSCKQCKNYARSQNAFEYVLTRGKPGAALLSSEDERVHLTRILTKTFADLAELSSVPQIKKALAPQRDYETRVDAMIDIINTAFHLHLKME
jgi:hypothetical protein